MMSETTRKAIERAKEIVGHKVFFDSDFEGIVSIATLKHYGLIEPAKAVIDKTEYTLEELVKTLNDMECEDCWYDTEVGKGEWAIEDGKAYYLWTRWGYRFI